MMQAMATLIEGWTPQSHVFRTDSQQEKAQGSDSYFLDSADQIHFFLEKDALDETGQLKSGLAKADALNKVGHGLHVRDETFRTYAQSQKVAKLVRTLGYKAPVLPQSMYIFKQAILGDAVTSHQDSSFLFTEPRPTCLGLWLALQDATLDNGCLWARPGSHKEPVRRHFARNPAYFANPGSGAPMMTFKQLHDGAAVPWEGGMPQPTPEAAGFVAAPIKQGDLFVIHGQVDHLSLPNTSPHSRHTFQLHLIEGPDAGVKWSEENWLQYPAGTSFPRL